MEEKTAWRNVLFVDDEVNILNALQRALMDEHFHSLFASSGEEALRVMAENEIAVLVTDMRMPGMDGLTLLKRVKASYPQTILMVLSGYAQLSQIIATINSADVFKFILKPWKLEEGFLNSIYEAVNYYNLRIKKDELEESLARQNKIYQKLFKNNEAILTGIKKDITQAKTAIDDVFRLIEKADIDEEPWIPEMMRLFLYGYISLCPLTEHEAALGIFIKEVKEKLDLDETEKIAISKITLTQKAAAYFNLGAYAVGAVDKIARTSGFVPMEGSIVFEKIPNDTDSDLLVVRRIYSTSKSKPSYSREHAFRLVKNLCEGYLIKIIYEQPKENLFAFSLIIPVVHTV